MTTKKAIGKYWYGRKIDSASRAFDSVSYLYTRGVIGNLEIKRLIRRIEILMRKQNENKNSKV